MAYTVSAAPAGTSLNTRASGFFGSILQAWKLRADYKRTYNELDALTSRDLADIGVRRDDIADIARLHVYGR